MTRPARFVPGVDTDVVLPRGTRCIVQAGSADDDGHAHRQGVHVVVREVRGRVCRVQTVDPAGMEPPSTAPHPRP